jgi:phosphoheptose isomerase
MTFPDSKFENTGTFVDAYFDELTKAAASVDRARITQAVELMEQTHEAGGTVYACGNGGSASISNHLACDHGKLLATDTGLTPHIHSLASNVEVITAIANDIDYSEVFVHQLKLLAGPGDALVTISSSGDSENVVKAAAWAGENGLSVISMTGFEGGRTAGLAHVNLHVTANNYGVIEDVHQSLMHLLGQFMRQKRMSADLITQRKF